MRRRHLMLAAAIVGFAAGCKSDDPYAGLDPKMKADYQKAAAFEKLPPEEQIRQIQANPSIPPNLKQLRINQLRYKARQGK